MLAASLSAANIDCVDLIFKRGDAEARCLDPVPASDLQEVARSRPVARQEKAADKKAARGESVGEISHRKRHVGKAMDQEHTLFGCVVGAAFGRVDLERGRGLELAYGVGGIKINLVDL